MTAYFEIAYAAVCGRLCLFTGTGFSKAVTGNLAPSWGELLRTVCADLPDATEIVQELFDAPGKNRLTLEEAAQVIAVERDKYNLPDIHDAVAEVLKGLSPIGDNSSIHALISGRKMDIVTTNYDKLAEMLAGSARCNSVSPGFPVPQNSLDVNVYHVHGSVDSPRNMVLTSDDYFRFMRNESYFSRKLSTLLHEDTVVILGYSLGDTNLRAILNDYKAFVREQAIGNNVFLVSKDSVSQYVKDYYGYCYGIRVIDDTNIHEFFRKTFLSLTEAESCLKSSLSNIRKVLDEGRSYADSYIGVRTSFYEIIAAVRAIGRSIDDPEVVRALGDVISKKISLTQETSAWEQYAHLAEWLVYLGGVLDIAGTSIEGTYLHAVLRSMTTMSKRLSLGYSWKAYEIWSAGWFEMNAQNRALIRAHIVGNATSKADAVELVNRG